MSGLPHGLIERILASTGGTWLAFLTLAAVLAVLSRLEVAKIKINPWPAIRRWMGDFFGAEHMARIKALEDTTDKTLTLLQEYIRSNDRREADKCRRRILTFDREICWEIKHSKEEYLDALETIREYETYCAEHPEYRNHVIGAAIEHIDEEYKAALRNHDFAERSTQA